MIIIYAGSLAIVMIVILIMITSYLETQNNKLEDENESLRAKEARHKEIIRNQNDILIFRKMICKRAYESLQNNNVNRAMEILLAEENFNDEPGPGRK